MKNELGYLQKAVRKSLLCFSSDSFLTNSEKYYLIEYFVAMKTQREISKKRSFEKCCLCDKLCQLSFMGHILTELFEKTDNWRQVYKQTSSTFYTSKGVCHQNNLEE